MSESFSGIFIGGGIALLLTSIVLFLVKRGGLDINTIIACRIDSIYLLLLGIFFLAVSYVLEKKEK